ncbi:UNVERIFIED_CONTAM: hypothetical protein GTU68_002996 [Idotea baltica]|nr:hypothetical protein [Idotea baltica]
MKTLKVKIFVGPLRDLMRLFTLQLTVYRNKHTHLEYFA